jgi:Tfp pilus assembly protein FimT
LVEVLLVLTVMVVIAAMAWPSLQRGFAGRRLHAAADGVRSELGQARVEAMRSGRTYTFRCVVHGDRYRMEPQDDPTAGGDGEPPATGEQDSQMSSDEATMADEKTLPDGVTFSACELTATADASTVQPSGAAQPAAASPPPAAATASNASPIGDGWSDPILFYPDGTTSNARVVLAGERNLAVELMLRGLTGMISANDSISAM